MALCREVDDAVDLFILHQPVNRLEVADVHLHELVVWLIFHILQVGKISGISELIEVDDIVVGIFVYEQAYDMGTDKSCSARDYYITFGHN